MSKTWYFLKVDGNVTKVEFEYDLNKKLEEHTAWNSIPIDQFLSVTEIAEHQLKQLPKEQLLTMSNMKKDELIGMHFGYGMWLRNSYALWHPNNPHVIKDDLGDGHPDGLSMLAIEEMYKRLTTSELTEIDAFQDAMSIVQEKK